MIDETKYKQYEAEILKVIEDKKIMRFTHVFGLYKGISQSTAYLYELEKSEAIKEALNRNRTYGVNYLLQKWMTSNNATLQIAAMRMICDIEEHKLLNQNYVDITTGGESVKPIEIVFKDFGNDTNDGTTDE